MAAEIERVEHPTGHVHYIIHSEYSKDALPVSAQELRDIYVWYVLHDRQVGEDAQHEARLEQHYSAEEITHARELLEHGSTEITDLVRRVLEESEERSMAEHPPYEVTSHQQARTWRKWTYDATDQQLLAALRGAGASWDTVSAGECRDELQQRGYTLVGAYPHEVTLEKPEGQPVDWSQERGNSGDNE
jgi:hypothetical protein